MKKTSFSEPAEVTALNTHFLFYGFAVLFFILLGVITARGALALGIFFFLIAAMGVVVTLFNPVFYRFSEAGLVIVYALGEKETIGWGSVSRIIRSGDWLSRHSPLPQFDVVHTRDPQQKVKFYMNGTVSATRKTKRLFKRFYPGEIG